MLAKINSCSVVGIDGFVVEVEVDISYGLPVFNIVGLPEVSVRESKDRVKTAIKNSGYQQSVIKHLRSRGRSYCLCGALLYALQYQAY